ncbi:MAG: sialidase family protein [Caldicoprobacterales bacterium]
MMDPGKGVKSGCFNIIPEGVPNGGILFVNNEAAGRSGHGGNTITECKNGDILCFYSNVSGEIFLGHGVAGWSEFRRSTDGGKTWSEPCIFDYSKKMWDGDECYSALVVSAVTAPNGTLVAIVARFENEKWIKRFPPVYLLSYDNGYTWSEPREIDNSASVHDLSLTYDGSFVHDDTIYVVFIGGAGDMCPGPYSLYVSTDNGETFNKRSNLPFDHLYNYGTGTVLDDGSIIVYAYPWDETEKTDEHNLPYVISRDGGYTWSEVKTAYFEKRLRNPQLSEKIGDYYFMHGRSGSMGDDPCHLVLYTSKDGINWDSGIFLNRGGRDADSYSANAVIGKHDESKPKKLLIQSSIAYDGRCKVNTCHWWIENISNA